MQGIELDRLDLRLLDQLQRDAHASNNVLSELVHLSPSQVSRRIQRLEELGLVDAYVALLNPAAVGLGVTAFTNVTLERHGEAQSDEFEQSVQGLKEVLECYAVTGEADYLLRVMAPDLASLSEFVMHKLLRISGVSSVKSNIILQKIKRTTCLPLDHLSRSPAGIAATQKKKKSSR